MTDSPVPADAKPLEAVPFAWRDALTRLASPERRRMGLALVLSLLCHALLVSLDFGGQEPGMPGFGFPWQDRRGEARDLRVVLGASPVTVVEAIKELPRTASSRARAVAGPVDRSSSSEPALTRSTEGAATTPPSRAAADAADGPPPARAVTAIDVVPLRPPRIEAITPPSTPGPSVIAVERAADPVLIVPPAPPEPAPDLRGRARPFEAGAVDGRASNGRS